MDNISRISIVFFFLCTAFLCNTEANVLKGLRCTGCGIVQLGKPRKIECSYPDGIPTLSSNEVTVSLDMYIGNLSAENIKVVDVLEDCKWSKINTGECNRLIKPGYNITKRNDQEFAITITSVTEDRLGIYIIQFALKPSLRSEPCSIHTDDTANPYKTTTTTNRPTTSTDDDEKLRNQVKDIKRRFVVCLVFLLILIIFIIVVIAMLICLPDKVMPIVITVSKLRSRNRASKEAGEIGDKEPRKPLLSDTQEAPKGSDAVPLSTRPKSDPPVHDAGETPGVVTPKTAAEEKPGLQIEGEGEATQGDVEEGQQPVTAAIAEEGDKPAEQSVTVETEGTQEGKKGEDGGKAAQDLATVNV